MFSSRLSILNMKPYKSYSVDEATKLMANYCAYQERCHVEIEKKLNELRMIPEAKEKIILFLIEHQFLNEERFAKSFAKGKFSIKKWGKIRITQELKQRKISSYNIQSALKEIDQNEYLNCLEQLAVKKLPLIKATTAYNKKGKLANYLISKGFESALVYTLIRKL